MTVAPRARPLPCCVSDRLVSLEGYSSESDRATEIVCAVAREHRGQLPPILSAID